MHERVEARLGIDSQLLYLPLVLLALALALLILRWTARIDRPAMWLFLGGGACWGLSQLLEGLAYRGGERADNCLFCMVPEELGESLGSLLLLAGLLTLRVAAPALIRPGPDEPA